MQDVAYVGDDINDLETIKMVGLGCCPADAMEAVKGNANYVSKKVGGTGVIRDVVDHILRENVKT